MATLEQQWKSIQKGIYNAVYRQSYDAMERQTSKICERFAELALSGEYGRLTGNSFTGVAVGLYLDGELLAYSTLMDIGYKAPITHAIRKGEVFEKGRVRYDDETQVKDFKPGKLGANSPYYAWRRAVNKLRNVHPSTKGYSFIIVHGSHYLAYSGYDEVMENLYADLRNAGAKHLRFHLRNT